MRQFFTKLFGQTKRNTRKSAPRRATRLGLENLEDRALLSVSPLQPTVSLPQGTNVSPTFTAPVARPEDRITLSAAGTLTLTGTPNRDQAEVRVVGGKVVAKLSQTYVSGVAPSINDKPPSFTLGAEKELDLAKVTKIVFHGYAGNDTFVNYTSMTSTAYGGEGHDDLKGAGGVDRLHGGAGDDDLDGGGGGDFLCGDGDNDTLIGGAGNDELAGGAGNDLYVFAGKNLGIDEVIEAASVDTDALDFAEFEATITGQGITLDLASTATQTYHGTTHKLTFSTSTGVENVKGSANADVLKGNSRANDLQGSGGADKLYGRSGDDTLRGGLGDDELHGEADKDKLYGDGNNDTLKGGWGVDTIYGGAGNDILEGEGDGDKLYGESGDDTLRGGAGIDQLFGGLNNDNLYGGADADTLKGEEGNDGLYGGDGTDSLTGGLGADRFLIHTGDSVVEYEAQDARLWFVDAAMQTFELDSGTETYGAGTWSEAEIERLDGAFVLLHRRTNDTTLLKKADGGEMIFTRYGAGSRGFNDTVQVALVDWIFTDSRDHYLEVYVLHEIGHNWDDDNPMLYGQFLAVSGWTATPPSAAYTPIAPKYGDVLWYRTGAEFVSDYAKTHPLDDFAESFAAYFARVAGWDTASWDMDPAAIPTKIALIDGWLDTID